MKHLGDFDLNTVVRDLFTTYSPNTGAPSALGGGSGPSVAVYKDNGTTQSASGVTLTLDFDGIPGLNSVTVDTSADGTFYSSGSHFSVVILNGAVDGVSVVGACVFSFSLRRDSSLKTGTNTGAVSFTGGVTISNASGDALTLNSSGGNGNGLSVSGAGTGDGIAATGGSTGRGIHALGGSSSGAGILAAARAGNSNGITATGDGSGHGLATTGGATGHGIHGLGGATSGSGIVAQGQGVNTNGLECIANGSGTDLVADNLATSAQATAIQAKTDNLPSDPADQSLVIAATTAIYDRIGAPAGASVSADIAAVKGDTAAILIDTAEIGAAGAGLTALANAADQTAVKAQTDKLTFNASNAVAANITHVIDDAVQQNGSTTTNWGGTP